MGECKICHGRTFIRDGEDDVWKPCECRLEQDKEDFLDLKLKNTFIPKHYTKYSIDSYKDSIRPDYLVKNNEAINIIQSILDNPTLFLENYRVIWIWGKDPNAGHTTFAIMVGVALIDAGLKVRFMEMQSIVNNFTNFENKERFFGELANYDAYIIDDAFDNTRTAVSDGYGRVQMFQFINNAFNNNKYFIMTSNTPLNSISNENDNKYEQCRIILQRSLLELELSGTLSLPVKHDVFKEVGSSTPKRKPI